MTDFQILCLVTAEGQKVKPAPARGKSLPGFPGLCRGPSHQPATTTVPTRRGMLLPQIRMDTSLCAPTGSSHHAGHSQLCSRSPAPAYGNVLGRPENWDC